MTFGKSALESPRSILFKNWHVGSLRIFYVRLLHDLCRTSTFQPQILENACKSQHNIKSSTRLITYHYKVGNTFTRCIRVFLNNYSEFYHVNRIISHLDHFFMPKKWPKIAIFEIRFFSGEVKVGKIVSRCKNNLWNPP